MKSRFILASLLFFSYWLLTFSVDDDIKCLQGIQKSLDADRELAWSFTNTTVPSICKLNGVTCWNQQETRIISLSLASMKLSGQVPESLKLCHSLQIVDLSSNALSGPIPPQLCSWLPYITQLDLSNNRLSGPIPAEIAECKFLNKLNLSNNKFSGPIPFEISRLGRLKEFSVADNDFSGPMPSDLARFRAESFEGNNRLCGEPLGKCGGLSGKRVGIIIAACVIGALGSMSIGLLIRWSFFDRVSEKKLLC